MLAVAVVTGDAAHPACVLIVTPPATTLFGNVRELSVSRLDLSPNRAELQAWERRESLATRVESSFLQRVWKVELPAQEVLTFFANLPQMCGNGLPQPKASVGFRAGVPIGGKVLGAIE